MIRANSGGRELKSRGGAGDPRFRFADQTEAEIAWRHAGRAAAGAGVADDVGHIATNKSLQSFDPVVQRAINRVQSFAETADATSYLRRAGIAGINFDLIYGLPHQTIASCLDTVARCVALRPDRFSVFGYAHVPAFKKHQRKIDESALPGSRERYEQACAIAEALTAAGYLQVGLDHFALPGDAMAVAFREGRLRRNFQGYTTDANDVLIGFGASAIGCLPRAMSRTRYRSALIPKPSRLAGSRPSRAMRLTMTTGCAQRSSSGSCATTASISARSARGTDRPRGPC